MIQRIQTLYLLIAALLVAALIFVPFAELTGKDGALYLFNISGIIVTSSSNSTTLVNTWPVLVLVCFSLLILITSIFLFKNRIAQIRISYVSISLLFGLKALMYYYTWSSTNVPTGGLHAKIYSTLPLIAAILVFLAVRNIRKDENLVKSIDRIR
ncbi:MAG: DUF4293 domain-containing protein [Prolixibacteraceae bacterium]|nr:DUF4293 domain-containing protein [Prolixibacteraceae bacterium]